MTHYDTTLAELADLTDEQRAWTRRRITAARRADLVEWAATAATFLVAAGAVVYTYTVGGWAAAVVAAMVIVVAALPVAAGFTVADVWRARRESRTRR